MRIKKAVIKKELSFSHRITVRIIRAVYSIYECKNEIPQNHKQLTTFHSFFQKFELVCSKLLKMMGIDGDKGIEIVYIEEKNILY
jgi:hypothetical protein